MSELRHLLCSKADNQEILLYGPMSSGIPRKVQGACIVTSEQTCECFHHGMRKIAEPFGYIERSDWAEAKMKTHVQRKCMKCGLYTIWTKKR